MLALYIEIDVHLFTITYPCVKFRPIIFIVNILHTHNIKYASNFH